MKKRQGSWRRKGLALSLLILSALSVGSVRADVVEWGWNSYSPSTVPAGLSGVAAISAGPYHSLALKADGTVVGWGANSVGQRQAPAGLKGVVAIAAGEAHSLALSRTGPSSPGATSSTASPLCRRD